MTRRRDRGPPQARRQEAPREPFDARPDTDVHTFLIADVRGYTSFTEQRGDEEAAKLAARFALLGRSIVEACGGRVLELRGDEALAVFTSPRAAIRAAVALQQSFVEETVADPTLPLTIGIGLDAGEAVPFEGGYRGAALNVAARLCSLARAGEILASREVVHLARRVEGVTFAERGKVKLAGLNKPLEVVVVRSKNEDLAAAIAPYVRPKTSSQMLRRWPARGGPSGKQGRTDRSRSKWIASATAALGVVVLVLLWTRGGQDHLARERNTGDGATIPRLPLKSIAQVDTEGNVLTSIPDAFTRGSARYLPDVAAGEGSVWLVAGGNVTQIDPESSDIEHITSVGLGDMYSVDIGFRTVWAGAATAVIRLDPGTGQTLRPVDIRGGIPSGATQVAVGMGAVWVTLSDAIGRIDPATGRLVSMEPVDDPTDVAVGEGAVWVLDNLNSSVFRLDSTTEKLGAPIRMSGDLAQIVAGAGSVWVLDRGGVVSLIDPRSQTVVDSVPVGDGVLTDITTAFDAAWVGSEDGDLYRIDPTTHEVTSFEVGGPIAAIAADRSSGTVWAAILCASGRGECSLG